MKYSKTQHINKNNKQTTIYKNKIYEIYKDCKATTQNQKTCNNYNNKKLHYTISKTIQPRKRIRILNNKATTEE